MSRRLSLVATIAFCAVLVLAAGCGDKQKQTTDPYRGDFETALNKATSDFEKQVLEDFDISRSEYEEAIARYVQCVTDRGVNIKAVPQYGYYTYDASGTNGDDIMAAEDGCHAGTNALIEPLYVDKLMNPTKADMNDLIADCLVRKKLAPAAYTGKQFKADRENKLADVPFDPNDNRFVDCQGNPTL